MADKTGKSVLVRNFSRHARSYDKNSDVQTRAAKVLADMLPYNGVSNVLEVGCGTGNYTALLKKRFPSCRIKAIDVSEAMIRIAKEKVAGVNTDFIIGDADLIELAGRYDLVTSNAVFHWLEDLEGFIEKASLVLSPSGRLVFSIFGPSTFSELKESLAFVSGKNVTIAADLFPGRQGIELVLERHFSKIRIIEKSLKESYPSLEAFLKKIKYSGTRGAGTGIKSLWSPARIKKIEKAYIGQFGAIEATYQIFFCEARLTRCDFLSGGQAWQ